MSQEEIEEQIEADEPDTELTDDPEPTPDPPKRYNVSSYGWDSDVEGLVKRLKRGDIFIPGFQRGFVWSGPEKSRFIESLILGLPVPNVFLAQDSKTKNLNIVDGQQRLRTLWDYLDGKFFLSGKDIQEEIKGCYFSREVAKSSSSKVLDDADTRSLADSVLHSIVIKPDVSDDDPERGHEYNQAIIQIFRRLNTSGKPLQAQEIRASIFYGQLDTLIRKLNDNPNWREIFGKKHSRLKDIELILRFIALRESHASYRSPMPKFLDDFMEENRDMEPSRADTINSAFERTVDLVVNMIGREKFRSGNTLTVSRFDAIMAGVDAYLEAYPEPDKATVLEKLAELENDEDYKWSIEKFVNDTDRVKKRIARSRNIFGS